MHKCFKKRRRFVTLIEIMIVMFLIALITGVVAYNYRGTLEKGKAFKTTLGMERLENILNLGLAENPNLNVAGEGWKDYIKTSPLVQNPKALEKDGWGNDYSVTIDVITGNVKVTSSNLDSYNLSHPN